MVNGMHRHFADLVIVPAHAPGAAGRLARATGPASTQAAA
jgi:hypothetical protein